MAGIQEVDVPRTDLMLQICGDLLRYRSRAVDLIVLIKKDEIVETVAVVESEVVEQI